MSNIKQEFGKIVWTDLTVQNAEEIRDFYSSVVGWKYSGVDMGEYEDFTMISHSGQTAISGICHARGDNADLPAQWLIYILVADLDESIKNCEALGGKVISGPKHMGKNRYCVIQDPAGAVAALFQQG